MGNQCKQKQDGGPALPVMLVELNHFPTVCNFSFLKRKTDAKNISLENIW